MADAPYKTSEEQLDFGQKCIETTVGGSVKVGGAASDLEHGAGIQAEGSILRELRALLKEKDPGFGGHIFIHRMLLEYFTGPEEQPDAQGGK